MIRVLIADNHPRARRSLQTLLTAIQWSDTSYSARGDRLMEIVGEATDGRQLIDQVQLLQPEVIVMDLNLPKIDGLTVITFLKRRWPAIRIVVLTMYANDRVAALEAGADAFLLKGCLTSELLAAVSSRI